MRTPAVYSHVNGSGPEGHARTTAGYSYVEGRTLCVQLELRAAKGTVRITAGNSRMKRVGPSGDMFEQPPDIRTSKGRAEGAMCEEPLVIRTLRGRAEGGHARTTAGYSHVQGSGRGMGACTNNRRARGRVFASHVPLMSRNDLLSL